MCSSRPTIGLSHARCVGGEEGREECSRKKNTRNSRSNRHPSLVWEKREEGERETQKQPPQSHLWKKEGVGGQVKVAG